MIMANMVPTGDNRWDGTIYNPDDGNTYRSNLKLQNADADEGRGLRFGVLQDHEIHSREVTSQMMHRLLPAVLSLAMTMAAPVFAQALQELPFDKQMKLAKVGDVDAQYAVGLAFETGEGARPMRPRPPRGTARRRCRGNVEAQYPPGPAGVEGREGPEAGSGRRP